MSTSRSNFRVSVTAIAAVLAMSISGCFHSAAKSSDGAAVDAPVSPPHTDGGGGDAAGTLTVPDGPTGFATQYMDPTTGQIQVVSGGTGAPASNVYVVTNRKQLLAALLNSNSPTFATNPMTAQNEPKIIYVSGSILGNQLDDGTLATADTYRMTPNPNQYNFDLYVMSFDTQLIARLTAQANPDGGADGGGDGGDPAVTAAAAQLALLKSQPASARTTFSNNQKSQIQFQVPPNTSLLGIGQDAKLTDGYLSINTDSASFGKTIDSNIIIRNIEFQVPQDYSPAWDPMDTSTGNWNARFDGITIVTGRNIWIDHCTFTDGVHVDTLEPTPFNGKHVQRHDGLIDIEDGSDNITISYNIFKQHDKTTLIGSTGGGTVGQDNYETGHERITFSANMWSTSVQRAPLGRWGEFHLYNNIYSGNYTDPNYPLLYFIGLGTGSSMLSESNVFDVTGSSDAFLKGRIFQGSGGSKFHDVGSWFNGAPFTDIEGMAMAKVGAAFTNAIGWTPPYPYVVGTTPDAVRNHVMANAGAGKLNLQPPAP
jgi:pectate lyase